MILLYSGGMDSYIAWHSLKKPRTIYFATGHRYMVHELNAVYLTIPSTEISSMLHLGKWERDDAYIPMRNAFLTMAAGLHDKDVVLVVQKGELDLADRTPWFMQEMGKIMSMLNNEHYLVTSPFTEMTKTDMVRWYVRQGLSVDDLLRTRSCYAGTMTIKPCGACSACFRRWVALTNNDIKEEMANDILTWEGTAKYLEDMKAGKYDGQRADETISALKKVGYV